MHSHQAEWLEATAGWVEVGKGRWPDPYQKMGPLARLLHFFVDFCEG